MWIQLRSRIPLLNLTTRPRTTTVVPANLDEVEVRRATVPTVAGSARLSPGKHVIAVDFNYDGGGVGLGGLATLSVDGNEVASERIEHSIGYRISLDETLDIGEDTGTPVSEDYHVPFKFTGEIDQVKIAITKEELTEEQLREMRRQLGRYVP